MTEQYENIKNDENAVSLIKKSMGRRKKNFRGLK